MDGTIEVLFKFMKRTIILHLIFVALAAILAYSNTLDVPFHFDDKPNIVNNPVTKDLKYFIEPSEARGLDEYSALMARYVGYLSFALNYKTHGLEVRGYHIANLAIHIINGLFVYLLVLLTFRTPKLEGSSLNDGSTLIALVAALFFVSHPVQTQAVTYIMQRFTSMATMFYLGSMVFYVRCRLSGGGGGRYLLFGMSIVLAVLAMKTKEFAVSLPAIVVLYEFLFFNGRIGRRVLYVAPFLFALMIIPLTLSGLEGPARELVIDMDDSVAAGEISHLGYLLTETGGAVTYLKLLILPIGQNFDYNFPLLQSFSEPPVYMSVLLMLALLGFGIYLLYKSRNSDNAIRVIAFGIFWFLITLLVGSAMVSNYAISEHRAYLPSIGFFMGLAAFSFMMISGIGRMGVRRALIFALVLVTLVLCSAAYARNSVWRSDMSLWEDVIRKTPRNARAHFMLGNIYMSRGLSNRAIQHYQNAIVYKPDFVAAYYNLGNIFRAKGLIEMATHHYESAVWLRPDHAEAHYELGSIFSSREETKKAIEHFRAATKFNPDNAEAHFKLARIYYDAGRPASALSRYKKAVEARPNYIEARYNVGLIYCKIKEYKKGLKEFEEILLIDPGYEQAKEMLELCEKQ
jgi:tetratricopeptide (TPR) repeat protein